VSAVPPTSSRLLVKRGGHDITRSIPKPTVIVDTREQNPFLFDQFGNWIGGTTRQALSPGDYSIVGMEKILRLERKSLPDLVLTLTKNRQRFFASCEALALFPHRAILVEASYEEIKTDYREFGIPSVAHPNAVCGSLDAIEAKFSIPVIYTSTDRDLSEEKAASWFSKQFTFWHLEASGMGRVLQPGDL